MDKWTEDLKTAVEELRLKGAALLTQPYGDGFTTARYTPHRETFAWRAQVAALLKSAPTLVAYLRESGLDTPRNDNCTGTVSRIAGVLDGLAADLDAGRVPGLGQQVRSETLSDLIDQADHLCSDHHHLGAIVVGGAALEAHLRALAEAHLELQGEELAEMNSLGKLNQPLHHAGIYDKPTKRLITSWTTLRNDAAHCKQTDFKKSTVQAYLFGIRSLMATLPP
jgi:hypothetical protein